MSKVNVTVCDNCENKIDDKPNILKVRLAHNRTMIVGDLCNECAASMFDGYPTRKMPGRRVKPNVES